MRVGCWTFLLLSSVLCPLASEAQAPQLIHYQGRLLHGTNLVNGTVGLSLRLFDGPAGGSALYEDSNAVAVADGLYSTFLGDQTNAGSLASALAAGEVWVETAVDGVALAPRERVGSVAYALNAVTAQGVAANAITAGMIATGALQAFHFATGAVGAVALADGAVGAAELASGAVTASALAEGAVTAGKISQTGTALRLERFLLNTNTFPFAGNDNLGRSVAGLGNGLLAVGFPGVDSPTSDCGRVDLYDAAGNVVTSLQQAVPVANVQFGYAVAAAGSNRIVVGAPLGPGQAFLYTAGGALVAALPNPAPTSSFQFGRAVAGLNNGRAVVGTMFHNEGSGFIGRAYLYNEFGGLVATITNPTPADSDSFTVAMAPVGPDRFAVGASADDIGATNAGCVYLYSAAGALLATVTNPVPEAGAQFGAAIAALPGDRFAVGAPNASVAGFSWVGRVFLFDYSGALVGSITSPVVQSFYGFGSGLAGLGTGHLVCAASGSFGGNLDLPLLHLYDAAGVLLDSEPAPTGDDEGLSFASLTDWGGTRLALGRPFSDSPARSDAGNVTVYELAARADGVVAAAAGTLLGILDTDHYSAYADLRQEGHLNNDADGDLLTRFQADSRYVNEGEPIAGPEGSRFAPAFSFQFDTDSGMYRPGFNQLGLSAGGKAALFLDDTGFAGVGTTNPAVQLHVSGGSPGAVSPSADALLAVENDANAFLHFLTPTGSTSGILFGNPADTLNASLRYNFFGGRELIFRTENSTRMVILTNGFVGIGTTAPTNRLHVNGTVQATAYLTSSDRNLKENIRPVSPAAILEKIAALPISTWTFKSEPNGTHIGPMAQDFRAAFGFGNTDTGIMTVDADGVALAAIQALAKENAELTKRLEKLEHELQAIRQEDNR